MFSAKSFSLKTLPVLFLWTLYCSALLIPPQDDNEAGELQSPAAMLRARDELVARGPLDALEAEAIEHAKQGDFEKYHELAVRAARLSEDPEVRAMADGPQKRDEAAGADAVVGGAEKCIGRGGWHITFRSGLACWDATYRAPPRDPHQHVIHTMRSVIMFTGGGRKLAAREGMSTLLKTAREADAARVAQEAEAAATKRRKARDARAASGVELYNERRSPDPSDLTTRGDAVPDLFGIHIHIHITWHFLDEISPFVNVITAAIVAGTVCWESYLEPPAFLLLAVAVYGLCGALAAEIVPAVINLVGTITHHA
ncbi:hypothetical protein Tdes44962_MAKER09110 [Teratosphaeria destructans]|uniref:Uncharacterized protein n=1 Tax=Teratosphaeria destructans TaxID=418781 RepID=A0A9W7SUF8_9PEZI|nr:hypothetical protein Tdes44962_MAKER09110 [Teratosphaeria destructans]